MKLLLALLLTGITLVKAPISVQAQPVANIPVAKMPVATAQEVKVISPTQIYMYHDGMYLRLLDAKNIKSATIEINFMNDIENLSTDFFTFPITTFTNSVANIKKLTLNVTDTKIISGENILDVAFIKAPYNTIVSVSVETVSHDNVTKTYTDFDTTFINGNYVLGTKPNTPVLPKPPIDDNMQVYPRPPIDDDMQVYPTPPVDDDMQVYPNHPTMPLSIK